MYTALTQCSTFYIIYQVGSIFDFHFKLFKTASWSFMRESVALTKVGVHHIQKQRDSHK